MLKLEITYLYLMRTYIRHGIFWTIIYFVWTYMKSGRLDSGTFLLINLVNIPLYMAAYYALKHIQLPYLYNRKKVFLFSMSIIFSSVLLYVIWRYFGIAWIDTAKGFSPRPFYLGLADFLTQSVQFYSPAMALLAWDNHHKSIKERERMHELEKERMSTELKYLKAQLNPHFLFNTLNNIYSFVVTGSSKAPDMILRLSGMLDYILYKSQSKSVTLSDEIVAITNFIELEQCRYGERLEIEFNFNGDKHQKVSPLIILSLVENAFKHGASGDIDNSQITIDINADHESITSIVWNTKSQHQGHVNDAYKEGIGLSNIKRQLDLIYNNNHTLTIKEDRNTFCVHLILKPL